MKIIPSKISDFKYEFDSKYKMHTWFDDKERGWVFIYNAEMYSKIESFEKLEIEVNELRSK